MTRSIRLRASSVAASFVVSWFALGALAGCSSDDDPGSPTGGAGGSSGSGGGSSAAAGGVLGGFEVRLVAADPVLNSDAYSSFAGTVYDSVVPDSGSWSLEAESGDCKLFAPRTPFCDPACGSNAVCADDDVCIANPTTVDVGTVRLEGVGSTPLSVTPGTNHYYMTPVTSTLPYPPAAEGARVSLSADGGSFGPFTIESEGIAPLDLSIPDPLPVAPNQPVVLTWVPGSSARARILVELDVSHHGGTKGKITCETADSGSLEIAASLVTELLALGVAGFPTIDVGRRAVGTARVARGDVVLLVVNDVKRNVSIPGLTSCGDPSECPTGQDCVDFRCE